MTDIEQRLFQGRCATCGKPFERILRVTEPGTPKYCSKDCKVEGRGRWIPKHEAPACPHPSKRPFRNIEQAWRYIGKRFSDDAYMKPYPCKCGTVHIGHLYPKTHPKHVSNR